MDLGLWNGARAVSPPQALSPISPVEDSTVIITEVEPTRLSQTLSSDISQPCQLGAAN